MNNIHVVHRTNYYGSSDHKPKCFSSAYLARKYLEAERRALVEQDDYEYDPDLAIAMSGYCEYLSTYCDEDHLHLASDLAFAVAELLRDNAEKRARRAVYERERRQKLSQRKAKGDSTK